MPLFVCVCEALCVIQDAEYYANILISIFEKCERVVCWRCLTSIWFPEKLGQMKFYVFFFSPQGFFFYWSNCFDQACQGAALCSLHGDTMLKSVWYVLHVRSTCKSGCSVLLMQGFSLLFSLSFSRDDSTAVQRKPGESHEGPLTVSVQT